MEAATEGGGSETSLQQAATDGLPPSLVDDKDSEPDKIPAPCLPKLNNNSCDDDMVCESKADVISDQQSDGQVAQIKDRVTFCDDGRQNGAVQQGTKTMNCDKDGKSLDSSVEISENGKRRRHRRKQKGGKHHPRRWKPYDKLTWDEKKVLEERECRRACQKRESRFASGQAMAPYNTTQFLMEQHEPEESELHLDDQRPTRDRVVSHRSQGEHHHFLGAGVSVQSGSGSGEGSSEDFDSNEEEIFLEKDFSEAYEQCQVEKLQSMTKDELVKDYMALECEVETLRRQVKSLENGANRNSSESGSGSQPPTPQVLRSVPLFPDDQAKATSKSTEMQREIQRLKMENDKLQAENRRLRIVEPFPGDLFPEKPFMETGS